jgi:hypothetical protein
MQQHTRHFWTHLVVLYSLEQEVGAAVLHGQILSSNFVIKVWHSLDLWEQLGTLGEKTGLNHDDCDLQDRSSSSRLGILSWMTIQNVFSQLELVFFF